MTIDQAVDVFGRELAAAFAADARRANEITSWIDLNAYVAQRLSMAEAPRGAQGEERDHLDLWDRALDDGLDVGGEG